MDNAALEEHVEIRRSSAAQARLEDLDSEKPTTNQERSEDRPRFGQTFLLAYFNNDRTWRDRGVDEILWCDNAELTGGAQIGNQVKVGALLAAAEEPARGPFVAGAAGGGAFFFECLMSQSNVMSIFTWFLAEML